MKTNLLSLVKKLFLLSICSFLLLSCSKKMMFASSSVVPAAEGSVKYKKDKNKNYHIDLKVLHLANSNKLSPARSTYVVWMETESNGVKNLGQLRSSGSLLSSTLKGSLKAVTPFEPKSFFITAEDDGNISYPGTEVVLKTN
ncbi:MAG: hypothetical protein ABIO55_02715 [Ginsengibacter sp.]